jgi:DNA repair exonuclease SbcCD ATPase subunit
MPPPVSEESHARVDKALGEVFKKVIDVAVTKSALQSQQFAARRRVERRNAEFEKSKPHHEKFPSIKESQTASKSDADRDYKIITEKVDEKDSLLNSLAMQAAEQLIPTLLARGAGNSAEQKNLQHRYESLEKTCKGFEKLLEEQRTLLEEQRKANEALKEKHLALEKDFRSVQGQFRDTQDVLQQVKISERAIEALRTDLATTKGDAAKILADSTRVSSELKTQARKIEALATGEDVETLRKGLKTLEETTSKATETSEEQFKILSEKLDKVDKLKATSDGLVNRLTNFAADQTKFREAWVQLSDRIDAVANRPDPTTLEDRLQKLEKISTLEVKESATKKELDALRDRVKQIERTPPPTAQNLPAKSNSKALDSRVDALEKRMIPVFASLDKLSTLEKNGIFTLKASEFVARNELKAVAERVKTIESKANVLDADNLSKGIDAKLEQRLKGLETDVSKFADFNKRINEVEDNQRRASSQANSAQTSAPLPNSRANPNSSSSAQPQFDELTSRISNLEKQVDDAKELQKVFEETWAGVVHDSITEESQKLQTRIASVEGKSFELNNNLEKLRESGLRETGFEESKKSILSEVVEIFKNRPNLLPFPTIDQVNTALVPFSGLAQMGSQIQRLHESTEATNLALGNLQSRVDNINTLDLANHIMGQLYALHPEATMNELKSDLKGLNARLSELVSTVDNLKGSTQNLEARVQDQETAEAMRQQYQDLRKEVDSLTEDGDSIRRRVKDAEKNFKDLSAIVNTTSKELGNLQTENEENKQTIAEEFARFQGGVEEQLEKIKEAASRVQVSKATSPAVSHTSNRSNQNGISRGPRPNFSTANRQPSATNDKSNKKRKLDNGTSAKTNGVRPGSSSGSPQSRKRHRRHPGGDDPEDDPDYSEEIPQPGVSSDEE